MRDLLAKTKMDEAKTITTPLAINGYLILNDNSSPADVIEYRCIIGDLQYLSLTWLDISYAVNKLSQFIHCPSQLHWIAIKCLLRYLKHTIYHGLFLRRNSPHLLHIFSYFDWAGKWNDRTSTTAFIVYLSSNPISWCFKKQRSVVVLLLKLSIKSLHPPLLNWLDNFSSQRASRSCVYYICHLLWQYWAYLCLC